MPGRTKDKRSGKSRKQLEVHDPAARREKDGLWDWNLATGQVHFSPRWISMLGCEAQEVGSTPEEWFRRIHPKDLKQVQLDIDALLAGNPRHFKNQHRLLHKDGTYRWMSCCGKVTVNKKGQPSRMKGSHSDISAEKAVDALTGLPNRVLLLDRLTRSIERAKGRNDFLYAVLMLDFDQFESRIECLGSTAADQVLIEAADRLENALRGGDMIARSGQDPLVARPEGDRFVILLDGLNEPGDAKSVAERLLSEILVPFEIGGQEVSLTASVGVALSATGYNTPEQALRDADAALRRAKLLGKGRCEIFDAAILHSAQSRFGLETDLRRALECQELTVFYQPIVSLPSSQIAGFEALVRWKHHIRDMVPPLEFIPVAEKTGLVVPLNKWVLRESCRRLRVWQDSLGIPPELFISVNLPRAHFQQPSLVDQIGEILSETGVEPHCLMLELTESVVMENPQAVSSRLNQLRALGVKIGIGDFGRCYPSLSDLRQFPVDLVKIDHSIVQRIGTSKDFLEIVHTICGLAHQLGLRVIAEGIENMEQASFIHELNCEFGQGVFFARPIDKGSAGLLLKMEILQNQRIEFGKENGRETRAEACKPDHAPSLSAADDPFPKAAMIARQGVRRAPRITSLLIASAALMLLLAGGYVVRLDRKTSGTSGQRLSRQSAALPKTSSGEPMPAELAAPLKTTSRGNASGETARPQTLTRDPDPSAQKPRIYKFPVVHQHVSGGCWGILRVSQEALSFVPDKGTDGFTLKHMEFSCAVSDDDLIIKSGSKTYRFRTAAAGGKAEERAQLGKIIQQISSVQQNLLSQGQ